MTAFDYDSNFIWLDCYSPLARGGGDVVGWFFSIKALFYPLNPSGAAVPVKEPFSTFVAAIPGDDWTQLVVDKKMCLSQRGCISRLPRFNNFKSPRNLLRIRSSFRCEMSVKY